MGTREGGGLLAGAVFLEGLLPRPEPFVAFTGGTDPGSLLAVQVEREPG